MKKYFAIFFLLTISAYADESPRVNLHTNFGLIVLELNPSKAPKTVENFLKYANNNFYDDTIFHRVIKKYIIQGGGYTKNYKKKKPTYEPIINESDNGLENSYGTIAMARSYRDPDSATSQFFINVKDNASLNYNDIMEEMGYTVFGKVIEGIDVVEKIQSLKTGAKGQLRKNVPQTPVIIEVVVVKDVNSAIESPVDTEISSVSEIPSEEGLDEKIEETIDEGDEEEIVENVDIIDILDTKEIDTEDIADSEDSVDENIVELSTIDVIEPDISLPPPKVGMEDIAELSTIDVIEPDVSPPPKIKLAIFDAHFPMLELTAEKIPIDKILPIAQEKVPESPKTASILAPDTPSQPDIPDPFPY
ncbi:peptidylprolyl isomerase [Candidatus Halobeggiatoa sp. HSG11]|nr:peptidylprolyl isomerase [Candidatus Halobeggiatoa sp. HSG11]